jgi:hypothetical protein
MEHMRIVRGRSNMVEVRTSWCGNAFAVVTLALLLFSLPAQAVDTVYMDPNGNDLNDGTSPAISQPSGAVRTLCRVQELLDARTDRTQDVEVRIAQGIYNEPGVRWRHYRPGHTISFIPLDYDPGEGIKDIAGRPIFRRSDVNSATACTSDAKGYWFVAGRKNSYDLGGDKNLIFRYLQVERYAPGGIWFDGGTTVDNDGVTVPTSTGINHNIVFGMMFYRLGSKLNDWGNGRGAIITANSSDNLFQYNHFVQIENRPDEISLIHGVYLGHHSNGNIIVSNRFDMVSGDPIRTRNDSNDNHFFNNTFVRSGYAAYYSEWFCDQDCVDTDPVNRDRECASHGNVFFDNYLESGYSGNAQGLWLLTPAGLNYAGGAGCDNEGQVRLSTYGNTRP